MAAKKAVFLFQIIVLPFIMGSNAPETQRECNTAVGMESGKIPDDKITASSFVSDEHGPSRGRLNAPGNPTGWSPKRKKKQWLQVDLGKSREVTGIATQGGTNIRGRPRWVTKYKLKYSDNGIYFKYFKSHGQKKVKEFDANKDGHTVTYHELDPPIIARYVRVEPKKSKKARIIMRMELYGCEEKPCDSNPCLNGGNCTNDAADSYSCQCANGWIGDICQAKINPCDSRPCLNGGNCTSEAGGNYRCHCVIGGLGDQCQFVILNKGLEDSDIVGNNTAQLDKLYGWLDGVTRLGTTQWKLCWRASQDGWAASTFHSKCDYKGSTVTIIKVDQYIFGGYASVPWISSDWHSDTGSFLFSLVNKPGWEPLKLPTYGEQDPSYRYTIRDIISYGPSFGGGEDLFISNEAASGADSFSNLGYSYSPPPGSHYEAPFSKTFLAGSFYFTPDEIEVFCESD